MDPDALVSFVHVGDCGSRVDAELKRSALEALGEHVVVATDDAGGLHPELARTRSGARLMAPADRAEAVRELIAELDAGDHALPSTGEHERLGATPTGRMRLPVAVLLVLAFAFLVARSTGLFY